jgi:hypothetical protein
VTTRRRVGYKTDNMKQPLRPLQPWKTAPNASTATGQTTNFVFLQSLEGHLRDPPEANLVSYWLFAALRVCLLLEGSLICPAKRQADFALSRDHGCWIQGTTLA